MPTIGQKLGKARRSRDLSIEDVAHETRIHPNMILCIEEDDFSHFPSVAYAKSFIRKYSDYLEVDISSEMSALNSGVTVRLSENELLGEMKNTINKDHRFRLERRPRGQRRRPEKPGGAPLFLNFILFCLIAALVIFYVLGYNASSPEEAKSEITKGLQHANPFGGPVEETAAVDPVAVPPVADAPATPPAAPVPAAETAIAKPEVKVQFEDDLAGAPPQNPAPAASTEANLRPRNTPGMVFVEEPVKPLSSSDLPAVRKPGAEPQAVLRPEGTDPAATRRQEEAARPKPAANPQNAGEQTPPASPIRAVPVAVSE
jgi:cytoskeletal protein RodZ